MNSSHTKKRGRRPCIYVAVIMTVILTVVVCILACRTYPHTSPYSDGTAESWFQDAQNPKNPDSIYKYSRHADLSTAGVGYSGYNESRLNAIISELEKYSEKTDSFLPAEKAIPLLLNSLIEESDHLASQSALADRAYYNDVNDEAMAKESARVTSSLIAASDRWNLAVSHVLEGPYGKILRKELGSDNSELFEGYEALTDKEKRLQSEETELVQQYEQIYSTNDDLTEYSSRLSSLYLKLVKNRNEQARLMGYDNYAEYAYPEVYFRDYSTKDAERFDRDVREYIVPLFYSACVSYAESDYVDVDKYNINAARYPKLIAPYMADIDSELMPAFNYMRRYKLADIGDSPSRYSAGYTSDLFEYGSPLLFYKTYDPFMDMTSVVHEFGHFNNAYHNPKHALIGSSECYDVSEIHSQGLEVLFLKYYDDIYGRDANAVKSYLIASWLSNITSGCMYDEFQREVYTHPDITAEELNKLSSRLCEEYGFIDSGFCTEKDAPYQWLYISHNFDSPMYYISYATSMFGAMEIWADSLDDRDAAISKYMEITAMNSESSYVETIKKCGLENPFEAGTVKDVAKRLKKTLSN